ncbi:hypothetical protein [Nostoc sp.]
MRLQQAIASPFWLAPLSASKLALKQCVVHTDESNRSQQIVVARDQMI